MLEYLIMIDYKTKISTKGQIVIPKEIRQILDIEKNTTLVINLNKQNEIIIRTSQPIHKLRGILKGKSKIKKVLTIKEMDDAIENAIIENYLNKK